MGHIIETSKLGTRRAARRRRRALAVILFASGVVISLFLFRCVRSWERLSLQSAITSRAEERVELLRSRMLCSLEVLHSIRSLFSLDQPVNRDRFGNFVKPALDRTPSLLALGWSPMIADAQRDQFVADARATEFPDFQMTQLDDAGHQRPAGRRAIYFPILYIEPVARNRAAVGFELSSNSVRDQALSRACDTAEPVATPPVGLVQELGSQPGFIVYLAVYHGPFGTIEQRRANLAGFASAVFRLGDVLGSSFADLEKIGLNATVLDESAGGTHLLDAEHRRSAGPAGLAKLELAGRIWEVILTPTPTFVAGHSDDQSWLILIAGLLATTLLCAYLYSAWRRADVVERRVEERTSQLSSEVQDRRRAESAARLAEAQYRDIFENSLEGMFQTSPDGRYLNANRALANMYGYESPGALIAHLANIASQLYVDPSRRQQFTQQIQASGCVSDFQSEVYRRDRSVIWISENARAVRDESGQVLYYEGSVVDVTARKVTEQDLSRRREELEQRVRERTNELALTNRALHAEVAERRRAEDTAAAASRAKSEFLANMSHEIRTPMNAILGYAQILHRDPTLRDNVRDAMETIVASGNHLIGLIEDILDLSKIEAGKVELQPEEFDLAAMVQSAAAMFRQRCVEKNLALRLEVPQAGGPVWVRGDCRRLRQVVINLLANAIKFTDEGQVELRVRSDTPGIYRFEVSDTGIGIAPESLRTIFEPFQQGPAGMQRGGAGLGLAIARQLIDLMGGQLAVASQPRVGSSFYFTLSLPAAAMERHARAAQPREAIALAPGRTIRAWVVDDVQANRAVLSDLLGQIGCHVTSAAGGVEALAMLESAVASGLPDVLFIDIMMPGMDGVATARRIRQSHTSDQLKLVATTAAAFSHERQDYLAAGFDELIPKPIQYERVYDCLTLLLGVEFQQPPVAEQSDEDSLLQSPIPSALMRRLRRAAQLHQVTDFKAALREIEQHVPESLGFSQRLRRCLHAYDMAAIVRLLDEQPQQAPMTAAAEGAA